jgi:hypothetical protein
VNAPTSDLSFVILMGAAATSAIPLFTRCIIPLHDPLPDIEPGESASWNTVLVKIIGIIIAFCYL